MAKGFWRQVLLHQRVWLAPHLTREIREEIAAQTCRALWIPMLLLAPLAQVALLLTVGLSEPTRFIPGLLWIGALFVAREVMRRRGPLDGFGVMLAGHIVTTTLAVLAHSIHAPAYWSNVLALAVIVPLYGARAGILLALWCALSGGAWFLLRHLGWTGGLVYPPSLFAYVFFIGNLLAGIVLMAIPTRLLAAALLSSERRRVDAAEARVAEQDAELAFRAVFEQTGAVTALVKPDGTLLRLNLTGERLMGVEGSAWIGRSVFELPWSQQDAVPRLEQALLQARNHTERLELDTTGPLGRRRLQLAIAPVKSLDGHLRALVVEGLDVTRLLDAERDLAHARRLEALGQLAGGVAHDFNNMLLAIQGALESLRSLRSSPDECAEAMETMEQAATRAADLTRKLLAFGRRDRFETQTIDIDLLIADATKLLRRALGAPIELLMDFEPGCKLVEGDASAIEHVLVNLMVNARDAMPRGGSVTMRTRLVERAEARCQVQDFPSGSGRLVELCVEDDGIGMSDEIRARAFDPFFTTKAVGEGSGLGLAAVHGTMLSHNGGVSVESQVNHGTCFRLYFPLAMQTSVSVRATPSGIGLTLQLAGRILVVDDEPLVLRVAKRHLVALGMTAELVQDAPTAIAALLSGRRFDCVLTDIVMPKMSGVMLVERIRELRPNMPIVVMSGFPAGAEGTVQDVLSDCPWLRKPFGRGDLARVIGPLLGGAVAERPPGGTDLPCCCS